MKTVVFFGSLIAVVLATPVTKTETHTDTKTVDNEFIIKQKKVLSLLQHVTQVNTDAEYYKIGNVYDIEANIEHYTNPKAVEEFLNIYKHGLLPADHTFSVYNSKVREEAIALYHLFYYAKDFETFFKTACWARVHLNAGMFTYSFEIAVIQRDDTQGIVLPAPYEVYPFYFVNSDVVARMHGVKMQGYTISTHVAELVGIFKEDNVFTINANYSGWVNTVNEEQRLSYFTEDIGLNTYYYYFHTNLPFWMTGDDFGILKERRGELYFHFYKQLLARFYMERLTNGLGEIPQLSWSSPVQTGYFPRMVNHNLQPFVPRSNFYYLQNDKNILDLQFLDSYENQFLEYLQKGYFKAFNQEVDFKNSKSVNFVGNYWQSNADLYEKTSPKNYEQYYEILAHVLLGGAPENVGKYQLTPVVLEHFQTALRDPVFFQLYKRIIYYFLQYKQYLEPYTRENLDFVGVKINNVNVNELVTYFDYFLFNASNAVYYSKEELNNIPYSFMVRQPRLNHKPFNVEIEVKSDVAVDAIVKIFLAPKYDGQGHPIDLEDNWMNFVELDYFKQKLTPGKNTIVRSSDDFFYFKEDSISSEQIMHFLEINKIPRDMSENYFLMPNRLMLPKGTKGGFPFQFFVMVYPYVPVSQDFGEYKNFFLDNKPLSYPFDRPIKELYFLQPNMYFENVLIKHEGHDYVHEYNVPAFKFQNVVSKN